MPKDLHKYLAHQAMLESEVHADRKAVYKTASTHQQLQEVGGSYKWQEEEFSQDKFIKIFSPLGKRLGDFGVMADYKVEVPGTKISYYEKAMVHCHYAQNAGYDQNRITDLARVLKTGCQEAKQSLTTTKALRQTVETGGFGGFAQAANAAQTKDSNKDSHPKKEGTFPAHKKQPGKSSS